MLIFLSLFFLSQEFITFFKSASKLMENLCFTYKILNNVKLKDKNKSKTYLNKIYLNRKINIQFEEYNHYVLGVINSYNREKKNVRLQIFAT